ncbi:MAG: preprotein translocase SecY subunit [Candidatus Nitrosomirales archaeon]|jgi:preprotein translocase SecY subunit
MPSVLEKLNFREIVKKISVYVPQVPKPKKKLTLTERFMWSGIALLLYLVMGQIPLYGAPTSVFDPFAFARVIFASQQGTLIELGIGPIVTAGLLMQLLKGSEIIKFDFKNPDERALFTSATKIVTIIVIVVEGSLYGSSVYQVPFNIGVVIIAQLIAASYIVMILDELVQKGWGLGSGISLFILAGVAQGILWSTFSPIPAGDGHSIGVIPFMIESVSSGIADFTDIMFRTGQLPSLFGFILTGGIVMLLVYTQGIRIEIPIVSSRFRGFTAVYPIKLLYLSNIPVILSSALTANAVFLAQMFWANYNPLNEKPYFNWIAQFNPADPRSPIGGVVYYLIPPRGLELAAIDPLKAILYIVILTTIVVIFGRLWVELGGLSAKAAARNLLDSNVQVPGFRRAESSVELLLQRYIPSVTFLGALILGLLAGGSDVLGVFGTGIGILLSVDISINYYNLLIKEQVETFMPKLGALLGRK